MKPYLASLSATLLATFVAAPCTAEEKEPKPGFTPVQLALWRPVQIFSANRDVFGLRIDLGAGDNDRVFGLDVGLVNLSNEEAGLELGAVSYAEVRFAGIQASAIANWVNTSTGSMSGLQLSLFNFSSSVNGIQLGVWNMVFELFSKGMLYGLQLGALNYGSGVRGAQLGVVDASEDASGVQLGAVNVATTASGVQLGVVNWSGENTKGLQIGLVNYCRSMTGVQIGLVNIIRDGPVVFLPVANASF